jgi:polysaccharide pyruvyl transferase WcaK-like protein
MAKAFVIWGGYGGHNLGDEAILWALSRQLRRLEPDARQSVLVLHEVSDRVRARYKEWGIETVSGGLPFSLKVLTNARLVVGGGQMVDDTTPAWPVGYTSLFILLNWFCGHKPLVVCIGAESLTRRFSRFLVGKIYVLARVCTCRDAESAKVLQDAGIPEYKIWTTRDVVFSLDPELLPQWRPSQDGTVLNISIVVAYDPNRIGETSDRSSQLIQALLRSGATVNLVAHDLRAEYDRRAVAEIHARFKGHPGVIAPVAESVNDVLQLYSKCDAVISGRMHPLILATLVGTLPIAFGGKAKVLSLLATSGIPALHTANPSQQSEEVLRLLERRHEVLPQLRVQMSEFRTNVMTVMEKAFALG